MNPGVAEETERKFEHVSDYVITTQGLGIIIFS